jgi:hypothetical protein
MENKLQVIFNQTQQGSKNKTIEDIVKKVAKIEKLKKDQELLIDKINTIKVKYEAQTKEVITNFTKSKEQYIELLIQRYNQKSFTKWQKEYIIDFINDEIEILKDMDLISGDFHKVISEYYSNQMKKLSNHEKQLRDEMAKNMFEEMGIELDDDFDFDNFGDPNFTESMKEKFQENFFKNQQSYKEEEKQNQVLNTDIDFQKLYKKLVKISHPDLAKSEFEKAAKEITMKKLTAAWNERNYYELIMIWMEIDPENSIDLQINESNQKNIIKQLNEKISDTEREIWKIKKHSEFSFYYSNFNAAKETTILNKIKNYSNDILIDTKKTNDLIIKYSKSENLKKDIIEIHENQEEDAFENFLFFLK